MQLYYYHFNKCAGTSVLHFFRNRTAESEFSYIERIESRIDERHTFDKRILHANGLTQETSFPWKPVNLAIFREPIQRAFSDFSMVTRWKNEITNDRLRAIHEATKDGVAAFFKSDREILAEYFNHVVKGLVGDAAFGQWFRETGVTSQSLTAAPTEKLLDLAIKKLDQIDLVLSVDDLSIVSDVASAISGRESFAPFSVALNSFNSRARLDLLAPDDKSALEAFNRLDSIIWERVQRRLGSDNLPELVRRISSGNDTCIVNFDQAIPADNIWPREVNGQKNSAWTGHDGDTTFYFRKRSNTRKHFCMLVTAFLVPFQFESMQLSVNGHDISWRHVDGPSGGFLVIAAIEPSFIAGSDIISVCIKVPLVRPDNPDDDRLLGLELSAVSLIADWEP